MLQEELERTEVARDGGLERLLDFVVSRDVDGIGEVHSRSSCVLHAAIALETLKPIAFDLSAEIAQTGRFVLIDNYQIAGGGVILDRAAKPLTDLVKKLGFPITNTLMGLGGYPATDKQFLGAYSCANDFLNFVTDCGFGSFAK